MKIKNGFRLHTIGKDTYAVAATPEAAALGSMIRLNETALFLWRLLECERTEEELLGALSTEYEIDEETARRDFAPFLLQLKEAGLIDG